MKKITTNEFNRLGKEMKRIDSVSSFLRKIDVGTGYIIRSKEWKYKGSPVKLIPTVTWLLRAKGESIKFTCKSLKNKKSWAILRTA